jgi:hypothetical protein
VVHVGYGEYLVLEATIAGLNIECNEWVILAIMRTGRTLAQLRFTMSINGRIAMVRFTAIHSRYHGKVHTSRAQCGESLRSLTQDITPVMLAEDSIRNYWLHCCDQTYANHNQQFTVHSLLLCYHHTGDACSDRIRETQDEYEARLRLAFELHTNQHHVVGRFQEGFQPGDDPGDDEGRPGGEDQ